MASGGTTFPFINVNRTLRNMNAQCISQDNVNYTGNCSFIYGSNSNVCGNNNSVVGNNNSIMGNNNTIEGRNLHVVGNNNNVVGDNNSITGNNNSIIGNNNIVRGRNCQIQGDNNRAIGRNNNAIGLHNLVSEDNSPSNENGGSNFTSFSAAGINNGSDVVIIENTLFINGRRYPNVMNYESGAMSSVPFQIQFPPVWPNNLPTNTQRRVNEVDVLEVPPGTSSNDDSRRNLDPNDLPTYISDSARGLVCEVCTDIIAVGEEVRILPCCHQYHKNCIDPWLRIATTCPSCQTDIRY